MITYLKANPWLYGVAFMLALKTLNGIAVWATAPEDPGDWERLKVVAPRRAAFVSLLRAWDIHPQKVVRSLLTIWSGDVDVSGLRFSKKELDK